MLREIGCNYDLHLVDRFENAQKSEYYLKINPLGRIPAMAIGDIIMYESPAICIHLAELFQDAKLCPFIGDPERPLFLQWMMYLTNTLQAELMIYYHPDRHTTNPSDEQGLFMIKNSADHSIVGMMVFLNNHLEGKKYLLGETLYACDFFLLMLLIWLEDLTQPPISFSNISSYMKSLMRKESVQYVCEFEKIDISLYLSS